MSLVKVQDGLDKLEEKEIPEIQHRTIDSTCNLKTIAKPQICRSLVWILGIFKIVLLTATLFLLSLTRIIIEKTDILVFFIPKLIE